MSSAIFQRLFRSKVDDSRVQSRRRAQTRRQIVVESLEDRRLMAADLVNYLTHEHVDINIMHDSSGWSIGPRNSDVTPAVQFANDEVVMYAGTPAVTVRPSGTAYDFIGTAAGENFYLLPQTQNPDALYAGFAGYGVELSALDSYDATAESKGRAVGEAAWIKASLTDVRHTMPNGALGSGEFSMWQSGVFGDAIVYVSSYDDGVSNPNGSGVDETDGISVDDAIWLVAGGHSHYDFGFTQPGRYEVDISASAYFGDDGLSTANTAGFSQSGSFTLYFSVMSVGQLQFDTTSYSVDENAGTASIDVVRVGGSDGRIAVDYSTLDGTALAGSDYTAQAGTLEFLDGELVKTITIPITDDDIDEGDLTFEVVLSNPTPANMNNYMVDVEGDGNGLIGTNASSTVTILDDLVRATFDRSVGIVDGSDLIDIRLVDIDNDSDLDVLFANRITSISVLRNNGGGTFGAPTELPAITVSDIHVADINGDNLPEIVSSVYLDDTYAETAIAVWRNLGSGNFSAMEIIESTRSTSFVVLTGVGDVDGDGLSDLVLSVDGISYVRNLGSDVFGAVTSIVTGGTTWSSSLRDVDQDGDLDVVRAYDESGEFRLQLLRNSGASTPAFAIEELASFGETIVRSVSIADTDQDGYSDIHLLKQASSSSEIVALRGTSAGAFLTPVVLASAAEPTDLKIGDIDGDGRLDLALASRDQNQVLFAQNLGTGAFTDLQQFTSDGVYLNPGHEVVEIGDIDGDGRSDLVYMERFADRIAWSRNRQGENITALTVPESRTYLNGYPMTFDVFLGFNVRLNMSGGSPTLPVTIGSQTIQVPFVGQPNANTLRFRYQVNSADLDLDGIEVANSVSMNGATITDVQGRPLAPSFLQFASVDTTGILVNGGAPYVTGITRLDATPADTDSVRYAVTFSESVLGVTIEDFALDASGPSGASITSVIGSGDSYVVTASIGSGDGTLKLRVLDDDSIVDANAHPLGGVGVGNGEFAYGQGYTIRSSTATPVFNNVITDGHLDLSLLLYEGTWYPYWNGVGFWDTTDTVLAAGPDAKATRPADDMWDFLGAAAGEPVWIFPETFSSTTPWPGIGAYDNQVGTFATYFESDPRINATAAWLKMQLLDVRGPEGGEFSLYQSDLTDPKVFMTTADGISSDDTAWIPNLDHIHYNWAFTKPGLYQVDVVASGYIDFNQSGTFEPGVDPLSESQIITLHFAVELSAQDDTFFVTSGDTLRGSVTLNDQTEWGIDASTVTMDSTTTKGSLSLLPSGSFTYQPSAAFDGSDSFTYRLNNPNGSFTTATVTITGSTHTNFEAVLKSGHTDIGVNYEEGAWDLHIHDEETDTEYEPAEALFYVGRDAMLTRDGDAADAAYDFLGVSVGDSLFVLPEVENTNLLYLGIGSEELAEGLLEGDVAHLQLASVSGPGEFSMWQAGLTPTTPNLIMATSDGIDASDTLEVFASSHAHANFGFTKQGYYEVTFIASGVDAEGHVTSSGPVTYYFYVTDGLVPFSMPNVLSPGLSVSGFNSELDDFNGDGILDLIVAGSGANALGYRQGVGDGSFLAEQGLNAGTGLSAEAIVAVDYDSDGDQDLLAMEYVQSVADTGAITLYRNDGSAIFTRIVLRSDLPVSYQVTAGDLNGDGRPDVVYGKSGTNVAYSLQQSTGELGAEVVLPVALSSMSGLFLGDMNNDGDLDVVVGNRANNPNAYFSVMSNDGNGLFSAPQNTTTGIFPEVHQLVDVNGDGRLDVVTGESVVGSRAGYYPQLADGTFGSRVVILPTNTQLNSIQVADINGDGVPDIVAGAIVSNFSLLWSPGLGGGAFGNAIRIDPSHGNMWSLQIGDLDGDGYSDLITTGTASATLPSAVKVYINKTGEDPMVLLTPAARTRVAGDPIDLDIYFGFPITVTGSPQIALQVGSETRYATYLSGSGNPTLKFRYLVTASDIDLDGVQLASNLIDLNGGTLTDPLGGNGVLEFPNELFSGVVANGAGPLVSGITRVDDRATDAASVRFQVQFNEDVTDVDPSDFDVVMNAGDLSGATIQSVTGSGSQYEVTVTTGIGSGTLGLSVKGTASILDLTGVVLARAFAGGEVYTVRKAPLGEIDIYYTDGHADYRPVFDNGEFSYIVHADPGVLPQVEHDSDDVYTYADSNAIVNRAAGTNYDFLGVPAGEPLYVLPSTQNVNLPFLGLSGESLVAGTFAAYRPTEDPRITSATIREYVKVQMVDMRSTSGGEFSLYSGTTPTVWMATSDGISETDNFWLYRTHFHRNLAFSKPGIYEVDVVISGYLDSNGNGIKDPTDVYVESGIKTMVFNVDTLGARDDAFTMAGNETLRGSVTLNDAWEDGFGAYIASVESTTSQGALTLQPNGAFTYQPSANFAGSDSFTYRLTNERGGFTTATVTITQGTAPEFVAVLSEGHADIGVNFEDDVWDLHIHDEENDIEYEPAEALLYVGPEALTARTGDAALPAYDFLGVAPGETLYVLPEVENPALLFLGIGTEELANGLLEGDSVQLELYSVSGPGHFSLWQSGLTPDAPALRMATSDGIDASDSLTLLASGHAHANFGFTKEGVYEITFVARATGLDGAELVSDPVTYYFRVGRSAAGVSEVIASGTSWDPSFVDTIDGGGAGAGNGIGLQLSSGMPSIPWQGLNRLQLQFSENVSAVSASTIELRDSTGPLPITVSYDPVTFIATIEIGVPITYSKLRLSVSDLVTDSLGMSLDGNNDGQAGDVFDLRFDVLVGDVNGDGRVNGTDLPGFAAAFNSTVGQASFNPRANWNGDDRVNGEDLTLFVSNFNKVLSALAEPGASFGGAGAGGAGARGRGAGAGGSTGFATNHDFFFESLGKEDEDEKKPNRKGSRIRM